MSGTVPPQRPRRVSDSHVVRQKDGAVLLRDDKGAEVALNPTAHALWELCDGRTDVDEIVGAVCELFAITPEQARADVRQALADMQAAGVIA
jgi:coenzyme PQQ synthesis protein D (PqqD)